ncbi:unannotated protein [freshwater metagenome]|uniref:Unannotated protein n=1 Tax=freshwater metagenome TaxID=449393 RepID=A0A6J7LF24_9ZZZZ
MKTKGTALPTPGRSGNCELTSLSQTPMSRPAARARGNERKPATSAVAVAASTRPVITVGCRVTIGAIKIAARPASALPSAQLNTAMRLGLSPSDEATRSFSATALVDSPNLV